MQGIAITEAACVGCRVGIKATASDNAGVWLRVLDSHFNVEDFGVEAVNIATVHATGNFIYLNDVGPSQARYHACFFADDDLAGDAMGEASPATPATAPSSRPRRNTGSTSTAPASPAAS